jgi:hypothetical protein
LECNNIGIGNRHGITCCRQDAGAALINSAPCRAASSWPKVKDESFQPGFGVVNLRPYYSIKLKRALFFAERLLLGPQAARPQKDAFSVLGQRSDYRVFHVRREFALVLELEDLDLQYGDLAWNAGGGVAGHGFLLPLSR